MRTAARLILVLSVACVVPVVAQMPGNMPMPPGAKKVPGEMWRQKMSMKMEGMSMPARTNDYCAPLNNPESAADMLPDKSCSTYDVRRSGNKTSMKFTCTGKDASEGTMDLSRDGNTMIMDMVMRPKSGGEMTMHGESTKLGKTCEAIDYSGMKMPEAPVAPDICAEMLKEVRKDMTRLSGMVAVHFGKDARCAKHASKKEFCEMAQSPSGFLTLHRDEYRADKQAKELGANAMTGQDPVMRMPLQSAMQGCGAGKGAAAVTAVRAKLLPVAEEKKSWHFLAAEGGQPVHLKMQAEAKASCTGRGFTEAKSAEASALCRYYGPDLIAGRFENVMKTAMGDSTDVGDATSVPSGSAAQGSDSAPPEGDKPNKAKESLDKGKKILRGIFGK